MRALSATAAVVAISVVCSADAAPVHVNASRTNSTTSARVAQKANAVTVTKIGNGHWRATYEFSSPVATLTFERPAAFFREHVWSVVTPGYHIARDGDMQTVALDTGKVAQSKIVFEFPEFFDNLPKEYEFFQPFSGGAVALYTGHFYASYSTSVSTVRSVHTVNIVPPPGTHAIVRGRVSKSTITYNDSIGDGTYVYLGTTQPLETPDVIAVVDPGMPQWLAQQFAREVPRLFATYGKRFGYALPWKPMVLYSFHDTASSGLSSGGGGLTGMLNMTLTGAAWKTQTSAAQEQAFYLIAHEAAHLWNGHLIENTDQAAGSWMHEGSADAFAADAMLTLGVIDSAKYRARVEDVINRCAKGVAAGPLSTALSRGAIKDAYDCGFVLSVWSVASVKRITPASDLFSIWQGLIASSRSTNSQYDQPRYFAELKRQGVADSVVLQMQTFIASRDSMSIAIRGLQAQGVRVAQGEGAPPAQFQQDLARSAMVHLMSQSCKRVSLTWSSPVKTGAVPACEPFAVEHFVTAVQGHAIRDDGAGVYDAVQLACSANGAVSLADDKGTTIVNVPCSKALSRRPVWYRVLQ